MENSCLAAILILFAILFLTPIYLKLLKPNSDRKNPQKVMKYKKILICESPNPSSISELIDNELKNSNVLLILN
jgi:hypothetical protein